MDFSQAPQSLQVEVLCAEYARSVDVTLGIEEVHIAVQAAFKSHPEVHIFGKRQDAGLHLPKTPSSYKNKKMRKIQRIILTFIRGAMWGYYRTNL